MGDSEDYYLIRTIKLAVYRITDIGDQVELRLVNEPRKAVSYKFLDTPPVTEMQKVTQVIEAEAKKNWVRSNTGGKLSIWK